MMAKIDLSLSFLFRISSSSTHLSTFHMCICHVVFISDTKIDISFQVVVLGFQDQIQRPPTDGCNWYFQGQMKWTSGNGAVCIQQQRYSLEVCADPAQPQQFFQIVSDSGNYAACAGILYIHFLNRSVTAIY
jgi:hypothetical protein